jgi:hypothetical protein
MQRIAFITAALVGLPTLALAQPVEPIYDPEHRLVGRVIQSEPWNLQLDRGPHIYLHQGTVIRPTGITLRYGMVVRVIGHRTDSDTFAADEVDVMPPGAMYR